MIGRKKEVRRNNGNRGGGRPFLYAIRAKGLGTLEKIWGSDFGEMKRNTVDEVELEARLKCRLKYGLSSDRSTDEV